MNGAPVGLACIRCGTAAPQAQAFFGCDACRREGVAANLSTVYDLDAARRTFEPGQLLGRPGGMWRFHELLPAGPDAAVSLGEGNTPLIRAPRLARELGVGTVWIKDESANPTWSFKDRGAAVTATMARAAGSTGLVVSSTGNAAAATAAYGRRAGLPALTLVAQGIDPTMRSFVAAYEPELVVTPRKADRWVLMGHAVREWRWYPNSNFADPPLGNNPYGVDGYKTIGFEIWEQLGHRAPEWIAMSVGYGDCLYGIYKGFTELGEAGLAAMPQLLAGEVSGSLTRTLDSGDDTLHRGGPTDGTIASSISNVQSTFQALSGLRGSEGAARTVDNADVRDAQRALVRSEGLHAEASSAAALAAVSRAVKDGLIGAHSEVVVVSTSAGMKSATAAPVETGEPAVLSDADELARHLNVRGCKPAVH